MSKYDIPLSGVGGVMLRGVQGLKILASVQH